MSNTIIATLGGISALVGWGISDWLVAKSSRNHSNLEVNAAVQVPGLIIVLAILPLLHSVPTTLSHVLAIVAVSTCFTVAYMFFIKAFSTGVTGVVAPIANAYPIFTLVLSFVFLSLRFSSLQVCSMIIIVLGSILLVMEKNPKKLPFSKLHRETLLSIGAAGMWGLGYFILNAVIGDVGWQSIVVVMSISMGLISIVLLALQSGKETLGKLKALSGDRGGILAGTILTVSSVLVYVAGNRTGSILIPAVIGSAAPLVATALGAIFDHERLNIIKRAGAVIVVAGIVLLNL